MQVPTCEIHDIEKYEGAVGKYRDFLCERCEDGDVHKRWDRTYLSVRYVARKGGREIGEYNTEKEANEALRKVTQ